MKKRSSQLSTGYCLESLDILGYLAKGTRLNTTVKMKTEGRGCEMGRIT